MRRDTAIEATIVATNAAVVDYLDEWGASYLGRHGSRELGRSAIAK